MDFIDEKLDNIKWAAGIAAAVLLLFVILLIVVIVQASMRVFHNIVVGLSAFVILLFAILAGVLCYYAYQTQNKIENVYNNLIRNLLGAWNTWNDGSLLKNVKKNESGTSVTPDTKKNESVTPDTKPNVPNVQTAPPIVSAPAKTATTVNTA